MEKRAFITCFLGIHHLRLREAFFLNLIFVFSLEKKNSFSSFHSLKNLFQLFFALTIASSRFLQHFTSPTTTTFLLF